MKNKLDTPLNRTKATWVASWLREEKDKMVNGGWLAVYNMTPEQVAEIYDVPAEEVVEAAEGKKRG